jgi:prephenate dehydrogenase
MQKSSKNKIFFNRITILGVGLIGSSFALAMKKNGLCNEAIGYGRKEENLKRAQARAIIDAFELDPAKACAGSDFVVLATPVGRFIDIAKQITSSLKSGVIVTDVGSVKGTLVSSMEELMPEGATFVGGHPIAGSDRSGIDSADAEIFRDAKCIITPTEHTDKNALEIVTSVWKDFGSLVTLISPHEHDRIYASVSHLPHFLAYVIMNTVADIDKSFLQFSGQGFMDTTRIASSSPELWRDICLLNKDNLLESLEQFKKILERTSQHLRAYDSASLEKDFEKARKLREDLGQH